MRERKSGEMGHVSIIAALGDLLITSMQLKYHSSDIFSKNMLLGAVSYENNRKIKLPCLRIQRQMHLNMIFYTRRRFLRKIN